MSDWVEGATGAIGLIRGLVNDMLARGAEKTKKRAAAIRRLAAVLEEIKTDLDRRVVPRENGHAFIQFLNLEDDLIKELDKRYHGLDLEETMKTTRQKVKEADLFIVELQKYKDMYEEKYKERDESGTPINDSYAEPVREATAQIERLVGTLNAISSKLDPLHK